MTNKHRIAIISADFPNIISGIGDYASILLNELNKTGYLTYLISTSHAAITKTPYSIFVKWEIRNLPQIFSFIRRNKIEGVIIQYPGILYGKTNVVIHLLCVFFRLSGLKIITTIHEFSNVFFLRRISELVFFCFSHRTILTNNWERSNILLRVIPQSTYRVIPIFPNIGISDFYSNQKSDTILYFGMIYPDKKIENVINLMAKIDNWKPGKFTFKFVVGTHIFEEKYATMIFNKATKMLKKSIWFSNLQTEMLSKNLDDVFFAIVFYNDGASIRRGSLLALLSAGIPIITNKGNYSDDFRELENKGVFYYSTEVELKNIVEKLKEDGDFYIQCTKKLHSFSKRFSLDKAVAKYISLLHELLY